MSIIGTSPDLVQKSVWNFSSPDSNLDFVWTRSKPDSSLDLVWTKFRFCFLKLENRKNFKFEQIKFRKIGNWKKRNIERAKNLKIRSFQFFLNSVQTRFILKYGTRQKSWPEKIQTLDEIWTCIGDGQLWTGRIEVKLRVKFNFVILIISCLLRFCLINVWLSTNHVT